MDRFGNKLKAIMKEKRYTQKDIAEVMGVKRQAVSQYCNGVTVPTVDKLEKLADHFGVSTDYLLGRVVAPEPKVPTFKDVFLKAFPKAIMYNDGIPLSCRASIFGGKCSLGSTKCFECWNQSYFEEEEKE